MSAPNASNTPDDHSQFFMNNTNVPFHNLNQLHLNTIQNLGEQHNSIHQYNISLNVHRQIGIIVARMREENFDASDTESDEDNDEYVADDVILEEPIRLYPPQAPQQNDINPPPIDFYNIGEINRAYWVSRFLAVSEDDYPALEEAYNRFMNYEYIGDDSCFESDIGYVSEDEPER